MNVVTYLDSKTFNISSGILNQSEPFRPTLESSKLSLVIVTTALLRPFAPAVGSSSEKPTTE
ncbi:unnamed protein product [Dovyalis caffra]|uniref:Uncharacterized protein n=1 Tax=Dovyalis caffra TaxID=77055 RepID=A0AAV1S8R8_9ROSI|nr:unnamed protein product [Dovyalis caffra]